MITSWHLLRTSIHTFINRCIHFSADTTIHSFILPFINSFMCQCINTLIRSFNRHSFFYRCVPVCIYKFIRLIICPFIHSFINVIIDSFVHSFFLPLIQPLLIQSHIQSGDLYQTLPWIQILSRLTSCWSSIKFHGNQRWTQLPDTGVCVNSSTRQLASLSQFLPSLASASLAYCTFALPSVGLFFCNVCLSFFVCSFVCSVAWLPDCLRLRA